MQRRKCQTQLEPSRTDCSGHHSAMLGNVNSACSRKLLQSRTTHTEQQTMTIMTHLQCLEQVERLPACSSSCPGMLQHRLHWAGTLPTADGSPCSTGERQTAPWSPQVWKPYLKLVKLGRASALRDFPLIPSPTWSPGLKHRLYNWIRSGKTLPTLPAAACSS